nr:LLM class flavin-dependent oxidoreductase [Candidatus Njordarchaeum guaymaensis]
MRFGIKLPHSGPLASVEAISRVALEAERVGLDSVWVHDHISYGRDWAGHRASGLANQITPEYEPDFYESMATLTYVAGFTKAIRLGTSILVLPLRNPLVLGRQAITLQALSERRLVLGVGIGDYPGDFKALNVPYTERGRITDEYLEVLRKVFRGGRVSHVGRYIRFDEAYFFPKTVPPPIIVGGGVVAVPEPGEDKLNLAVLRRVARFAEGWMPDWGEPELIRKGVGMLNDLAHDYGREDVDFEICMSKTLYLADSDEVARVETEKSVQEAERVANIVAGIGIKSPEKALESSLIGSPDTLIKRIKDYYEAGVRLFIMTCLSPDLNSFVDTLRRFDREVASTFR